MSKLICQVCKILIIQRITDFKRDNFERRSRETICTRFVLTDGRGAYTKRGERSRLSTLWTRVLPAGYCVIGLRSVQSRVFRARRVSRQWLKSRTGRKSGVPPFFFLSPLPVSHRVPLCPPRAPLRYLLIRVFYMSEKERDGNSDWGEGQKVAEEKKRGHTKIVAVYHHQVDIYTLPASPTLSPALFFARSQLYFFLSFS